jgi:hypothetical protein
VRGIDPYIEGRQAVSGSTASQGAGARVAGEAAGDRSGTLLPVGQAPAQALGRHLSEPA